MKRILKKCAPALKVFLLVALFLLATYNQYSNTARAYDNGSGDYNYCQWYPEDPQCGTDPCDGSAGPPPPECFTFCELNPDDPSCVEDPCFSSSPPSSCECDGAYGPPPPECTDPCSGNVGPPPPECFDPCSGNMGPPPPECSDPCSGEMGPPPPECINYYCNDGGYCSGEYPEDPVPCNYNPTGDGVADPKQGDPSSCDCSCKATTQYYCGDIAYCDGGMPTNYEDHSGEEGWERDDSLCACDPLYFCDDPTYCDGAPACNYAPEHRGVYPWQADNSVCECQDYCPEEDDPNYQDPSGLTCPRANYELCEVKFGCMDSTAYNYDPEAEEHDQTMCQYLKSTACAYEVMFEVDKLNSQTGNIRNYAVGVLQIVVVSYLSDDPDALDPTCPGLDVEAFTAAHYAFIYDFLFPSWPSFDYGSVSYFNLGESEDFCANLAGIQNEVPAGYVKSGADCIPDEVCFEQGCQLINGVCTCTDMCPNIAGNQTTIPAGYYLDGNGNCVTGEECTENGCSLIDGVCRCPVNGDCATYSPNPSGPEPSGLLCTTGNPSAITLSSHSYDYTCQGLWGGADELCSVGMLCAGQKYCATNPVSTQCVDTNQCCEGFVMCPNGQCKPGTLANCNDTDLVCDESVSPPMCSRGGAIVMGLRMTPPVSDIDTNSCKISWEVQAAGGSVTCALTRDGASVQSYGASTIDRTYEQDVEPGRYEVTCQRLSTEIAVDAEGVESTYILRVEDEQSMSCVQNPNYVEF